MPIKDPDKQRESVKVAKRKYDKKQKLNKYFTEGVFDLQKAIDDPAFQMMCFSAIQDGLAGKRINSQILRLATELTGYLAKKKESGAKVELTSSDIASESERIIGYFRERLEEAPGICPLCGKSNLLLTEVCDNQVN